MRFALSLFIAAVLMTFAQATAVFAQSSNQAGPPQGTTAAPASSPADTQPSQPADTAAKRPRKHDPQRQCVDIREVKDELVSGIRPVGDPIVLETNFLPTGGRVDVGVRTTFVEHTRYFAFINRDDGSPRLLFRQDVSTRRAVEADPLVKKRLLDADQTIVSLNLDDANAGLWHTADLYLYTCGVIGSPARVSRINVRFSPYWYSIWLCVAAIVILYCWVAYATRRQDHTFRSFVRSLDPVRLTAGPDGKGSLSKFQILSFSLVVFGLILLFMLQTGNLSDLSGTILALLGINGIGATIAKGADAQRNTLSADNRAWLLRKNWIPTAKAPADSSNASWRDFFSTDGEFDVYRFQSFIFSLVVGLALIAAGVTQLSTFAIPDTVLGIVGLSQAVYIGGKLVTPTNMSDLNTAIADLRDREKKLKDAAVTAKQGAAVANLQEAIGLVGQNSYDAYLDKARDVSALFTEQTGIYVDPSRLPPSVN